MPDPLSMLAAAAVGGVVVWGALRLAADSRERLEDAADAGRIAKIEAELTAYRGEVQDALDRVDRLDARWRKRRERGTDTESEEPSRSEMKRRMLQGLPPLGG